MAGRSAQIEANAFAVLVSAIKDTTDTSANVLLATKPMESNVAVAVYAIVVFVIAWMDGKAAAVNVRPATNFALLPAAKKYVLGMDIVIVDNADATRQLLIVCIIEERIANRLQAQVAVDFAVSTTLA